MLKICKLTKHSKKFGLVRLIRSEVFVQEQGVSLSDEYDQYEELSTHYLMTYNDKAIACARSRKTDLGLKLERFAVLKEFRGQGYGKQLVKWVLADLKSNGKPIYLHSQLQVEKFYSNLNFEKVGDQFEEAGILHFKMIFRS